MDRKYAIGQILKHKWFVFVAGIGLGCNLLGLILHDLSKFYPCERRAVDDARPYAWNYHANRNRHHCEFWYSRTGGRGCGDFENGQVLPMPRRYIKEMVADWFGASRAYNGHWPPKTGWTWFNSNFSKMLMHPHTRYEVTQLLMRKGYLK